VTSPSTLQAQVRRVGFYLLVTGILLLVYWLLRRELRHYDLADVISHVAAIPFSTLFLAVLLTAASYLCLTAYDWLALRYVGKSIRYPRVAMTSFIAYALNHNLSVAALTGTAIRYRFYSPRGLTNAQLAMVVAFCGLSTSLGLATLAGVSLLVAPPRILGLLGARESVSIALGVALLALPAAYLAWAAFGSEPLRIRRFTMRRPALPLAAAQILVAVADLTLAATVLWVLLPHGAHISLIAFTSLFAVAVVAGIVSNVPGGLGVFESVLIFGLRELPADALLGSLLVYRAIYYLLPLGLAAVLFVSHEVHGQRARIGSVSSRASFYLAPIAPQVGAVLAFMSGVVLLVSGATPAIDARLHTLRGLLPAPLLELSHLIGSMAGLALLVLAHGLLRRVSTAYHVTVWLLLAGIVASVTKGLDFEEASFLAVVLAILWFGRAAFYRASSLANEQFSRGWVFSVLGVVAVSILIAWLNHQEQFASTSWWSFSHVGDTSRVLRTTVLVAAASLVLFVAYLLRPARNLLLATCEPDLARIERAASAANDTLFNAVRTGDKHVLYHEQADAFIMYQVRGRSWIALGDPVGAAGPCRDLTRQFRALVDRAGGWTVFYQVAAEQLPLYVDLGLTLVKLGEEARVPLASFSLDGSARADLRQSHRRAMRDGATFEIVPREAVSPLLATLRRISDTWLAHKAVAEKAFSVGAFSEQYIQQFPLALVRVEGHPVAFANLWSTANRHELSIDLMRFGADAPKGAMDFLFTELMLWGRANGYGYFNLGMAPLAGLEPHALAPPWHRMGSFVFRHGEHFYNFEGLKRYKEKFLPAWSPRYIALPGRLILPRVLLDVSRLISGGLKGLVSK